MAKDTKYIRKRKRKYGYAFLIEIPFQDENGDARRFTETVRVIDFGTEKSALLAAQKIRNDALHDIQSGKLRRSFPTVGNLYRRKWQLMPLSVNTKEKQDAIFNKAIFPYENTLINDLTVEDIQLCVNQYAESHSDDAVSRLMTVWRQIFKTCLILGYDVPDKTQAVIVPKSKVVTQRKDVRMSYGDFKTVLDGLLTYSGSETYNNRGIWFMLQIMYYTGCRPAEALALTADDITDDFISISKSVGSTTKEKQQIVPPKTEASNRRIPVPPDLLPILHELKSWSRHKYLLSDANGRLRDIDEVSNTIHLVARKHGVRFNAYMLRHLMSTELLHRGDSVVARDLLGHTSFSMTLDYARSTDDQLLEAIRNRSIAEKQPKNTRLSDPPATIVRRYQIRRICTILLTIIEIKGFLHER